MRQFHTCFKYSLTAGHKNYNTEANAVQSTVYCYGVNMQTHNLKYIGTLGKFYGLINEKAH